MIVIGADTHKSTHTCAAVLAANGQIAGELTAPAREPVAEIRRRTRRAQELEAEIAPIPASSGKRVRYRLDRGGNRQLNCALHRIAVTQGRMHPPARTYLARKQAEGKSRSEALRCLKRHLARRVRQLLIKSAIDLSMSNPVHPQRGSLPSQIAAVA